MIKGEKVILRHPMIEDALLWCEWLNDMDVSMPLGDELTGKISLRSVEEQIMSYDQSDYYMFSILTNDAKLIGRCILFGIDRINSKGKVGIFIGDKSEWGKGYAKEALELLLEYGFRIQNLHSINLGVYENNQRAIELYIHIGFKKIGVLRDAKKINGQFVNVVFMDMLENEYENKYIDFSSITER